MKIMNFTRSLVGIIAVTSGLIVGTIAPLSLSRVAGVEVARPASPGIPKKIMIPALSINREIEQVGLDSSRRMGVPENVYNAGWYKYGVRPGENGNAVIDGHVNTPELAPSLFAHLDTLRTGDEVMIMDSDGHEWQFKVLRVEKIPDENFPINTVFGPADKPYLNLITCSGQWDRKSKNFTERTVVFTELK